MTGGGKRLKYQKHNNRQWNNPENGLIGKGRGLLAGAVLSQQSRAVRPQFDLKGDEPAGSAKLGGRRAQKLFEHFAFLSIRITYLFGRL
jgi:hypothetical protein